MKFRFVQKAAICQSFVIKSPMTDANCKRLLVSGPGKEDSSDYFVATFSYLHPAITVHLHYKIFFFDTAHLI